MSFYKILEDAFEYLSAAKCLETPDILLLSPQSIRLLDTEKGFLSKLHIIGAESFNDDDFVFLGASWRYKYEL